MWLYFMYRVEGDYGNSIQTFGRFGKRMEYNLVGKMLMEGLDVYMPLVDDHGVDCVIKKEDGTFIEVQIKARSNEVTDGDAALFRQLPMRRPRTSTLCFILSVWR